MTHTDDIDTTETRLTNSIIKWLAQAQASGHPALAGTHQSKLVKLAWTFMRAGLTKPEDLHAHLDAHVRREAEIALAWETRKATETTEADAKARRDAEIKRAWKDRTPPRDAVETQLAHHQKIKATHTAFLKNFTLKENQA